ncbi:hypothetical protein SAMN04487970_10675 [Paenibacillus tianmuensis]|uniref:Uncharacterized protein n=1 Tax=Paenibacillus tianmuensis TaxID=624147 RepID=A0A1G4TVI8_9BACL|nr:hypothetical protein SAMN04487970_10675 [Paenibacillus tianmuensis]
MREYMYGGPDAKANVRPETFRSAPAGVAYSKYTQLIRRIYPPVMKIKPCRPRRGAYYNR